jgi:hypothetical protein
LKEAFPVLFCIACANDASIADNMELLGGSTQWNVSFIREAHDLEVDIFASFFQVLHSIIVSRGRENRLWWVSSKIGMFKVKSFLAPWLVLKVVALHERVWQTQDPLRVIFFCVVAVIGKILTVDNLKKRHYYSGQILLVQEKWEISGPSSSSLRCCFCSVECSLFSIWHVLGMPKRVIYLFAC